MADNYLEKRMEEYRAGRLANKSKVVVKSVAKGRPGDVVVNFPSLRVLLLGGPVGLISRISGMFRMAGSKVAFCHGDRKKCTPVAQANGSRYYPYDMADFSKVDLIIDDLSDRWNGFDVVIDLRDVVDDVKNEYVDPLSMLLVLHSHPMFGFVAHTDVDL